MMRQSLLLAASLAALSLGGCKKEADPATEATAPVEATPTPAIATPAVSEGQSFANVAAASDSFEIEASKLAATKAGSAKVKAFADQMVKAHTDSTAKLKAAAAAASPAITPDPALSAAQQAKLDDLSTKSGEAFDRAYAQAQVDAHQATLDALKGYSAGGTVPSLKDLATQLTPVVTAHLNMAKAL
jgi:putative membrane protein